MDPQTARRLSPSTPWRAGTSRDGPAYDRDARLRGRWILVIDDDPSVRVLSARILLEHGAICQLASQHDQALQILEREPQFEVAILDYQMPDGDGAALVPRLLALHPSLTVVGSSGANRQLEFEQVGVERFLQKPWGINDLIAVLDA